MSHEALNQSSG